MSLPKLTYFDFPGLAEPIRFILSYAGVEFIDERIKPEDWPEVKKTTPLPKLPLMEIEGQIVNQSSSICRHYAKKTDLAGKDDWENLLIDATVGTFEDFRLAITMSFQEFDEETKKKKFKILTSETAPFYLERMNKQVEENGGYLVNGKLTWADLWVVAIMETWCSLIETDVFKKYPHIEALKQKVFSLPAIASWIAKRPPSVVSKDRKITSEN